VENSGNQSPLICCLSCFDPFRGAQRQTGRTEDSAWVCTSCKQIVLAHGGHVEVKSGENNRTTFAVRNPALSAVFEPSNTFAKRCISANVL